MCATYSYDCCFGVYILFLWIVPLLEVMVWIICGVVDLVCRVSLLVYSGTLELAGTLVGIGVDGALVVFLCIMRSVI